MSPMLDLSAFFAVQAAKESSIMTESARANIFFIKSDPPKEIGAEHSTPLFALK
jgi:hypothetical protein